MDELRFKTKIGKFIFFSNIVLFGLLVLFYLLKGFDDEQFIDLLKFLTPIKVIYFTALIKYILHHKDHDSATEGSDKLSELYKTVVRFMVYTHICSMIFVITAKALFNLFDYNTLKNLIILIETFFGAYIGFIMTSLFNVDEKEG